MEVTKMAKKNAYQVQGTNYVQIFDTKKEAYDTAKLFSQRTNKSYLVNTITKQEVFAGGKKR